MDAPVNLVSLARCVDEIHTASLLLLAPDQSYGSNSAHLDTSREQHGLDGVSQDCEGRHAKQCEGLRRELRCSCHSEPPPR